MNLAKSERGETLFNAYAGLEVKAFRLKRPFSFLPPVINNTGDWSTFIDTAYQVYKGDFIDNSPHFLGKRVIIDRRNLDGGYVEGFWHVVQRDMGGGGERYTDFQRLERVPWIKPLIENHTAEGVEYRRCLEGKRETRHYILAPSKNYVVILGEKKGAIFLVTAFCMNRSFADRAIFRQPPHGELAGRR
ncbi:MAG: hypothetical protein HZA03_00835 [Nitrospinae bacterium]|nr:hypothetical protein [Nitrospinota bacterium]